MGNATNQQKHICRGDILFCKASYTAERYTSTYVKKNVYQINPACDYGFRCVLTVSITGHRIHLASVTRLIKRSWMRNYF